MVLCFVECSSFSSWNRNSNWCLRATPKPHKLSVYVLDTRNGFAFENSNISIRILLDTNEKECKKEFWQKRTSILHHRFYCNRWCMLCVCVCVHQCTHVTLFYRKSYIQIVIIISHSVASTKLTHIHKTQKNVWKIYCRNFSHLYPSTYIGCIKLNVLVDVYSVCAVDSAFTRKQNHII